MPALRVSAWKAVLLDIKSGGYVKLWWNPGLRHTREELLVSKATPMERLQTSVSPNIQLGARVKVVKTNTVSVVEYVPQTESIFSLLVFILQHNIYI